MKAIIVPIFKKKREINEIENYRPISLTKVNRKIFEALILQMSNKFIALGINQGGFRTRRGTFDQVICLDEYIKRLKRKNQERIVAFLDIQKAYDSVDREILWLKLNKKGLSNNIMKIFRSLFDYNQIQVLVDGRLSKGLKLPMGLLQGSILSPILYASFIDDICENNNNNNSTKMLLYANDIAICDKNEQ